MLYLIGTNVEQRNGGIFVSRSNSELVGVDVETEPYPGFPTDLQAQFIALMAALGLSAENFAHTLRTQNQVIDSGFLEVGRERMRIALYDARDPHPAADADESVPLRRPPGSPIRGSTRLSSAASAAPTPEPRIRRTDDVLRSGRDRLETES